jgi:hypothetical protein
MMVSRSVFFALVAVVFPALCFAEEVRFNRDIRPLLTKHCTACHGGVKEAGDVSFIFREKALGKGESGNATIVPGKPELSEMVRRIKSSDPDEVMPQPKHGPPLSKDEIALVEQWIREGAKWQDHWAFMPPVDSGAPKVSNSGWVSVPFDAHVLGRLEREKLAPSPEAPPAEWLRRVSFDLTGVPPSVEELAAFEAAFAADTNGARVAVVDRLLGSPRFGERWAAMWLDLARYSDTYGFEKDPHRDIWPFRDWVIRAFNADMPYDQFTIEQLAGDLLPNPTADQRLATAFHRNTQTNTEGGTDDEEFRVAAVIDRVSTTWTTWQATTFGCVQCHSHPYDPIAHEDFYRFTAFFNSSEDTDLDDDFPTMRIANDPALRDEASSLEVRSRSLRQQINEGGSSLAASTADWSRFKADQFAPTHGTLSSGGDGIVRAEGTFPAGNIHKVSGPAQGFTALRLQILPESDDPKKWPERGSFVNEFTVNLVDAAGVATKVEMKEVFADFLAGPHEPNAGGNVGDYPKLHSPRWFVFVPAAPVAVVEGARLEISMRQGLSTTGNQGTPVRRFAVDFSNRPEWTAVVQDPARAAQWAELGQMRHRHGQIPGMHVPVMVERPAAGARETRVFARGNRLTKDDAVKPGLPSLLSSELHDAAATRLDMAKWLVDGKNPLTARVLANRLWGEMFGIGIVETAEDFGTSGTPPTHLELLDHLALRLQGEHKWSMKSFLREIALSSTYRQSHRVSGDLAKRDPMNQLLARGPRLRLTAEMVRDQALAAGGLLAAKMHGPPVYPPQPAGVWNTVYSGMAWNESQGEDRYRRGIYTYSRRTSGFPGFLTFDAPSRDLCTARRISTNTPLQALVTLNDPAHLEAAKALVKRMTGHSGDLRERIAFGYRVVTQQSATPAILDDLAKLHADAQSEYAATPAESAKLGSTPDEAALVLVGNTLLNLDSALTK